MIGYPYLRLKRLPSFTLTGNITTTDGSTIGSSASGPVLTFDDTSDELKLGGAKLNVQSTAFAQQLTTMAGDGDKWFLVSGSTTQKISQLSGNHIGVYSGGNVQFYPGGTLKVTFDISGNINATGVYKVDDVQVVGNRVVDARCDDAVNSGDATTDGVIDALRDAMITHGLIAAA